MRLTCARSMSQMGHERRIEGTGGVSGPPPIAAKSARFGYGPVPGRCPTGAGSHATPTAIVCAERRPEDATVAGW